MKDFTDKIAVVTGGGSGIGRELVHQLAKAGARVAMCDVSAETMEQTVALIHEDTPGAHIHTRVVDVSKEEQLEGFRDSICDRFDTDHIHLLFNNAGIAGGGSMITANRTSWERTFDVTWGGVYLGTRVFLPLLIAAPEAMLINTSSVNGFYASVGDEHPITAYAAAKFAVKGFSEALITDLRLNAPHVGVAVVMPGHISTPIVRNTMLAQTREPTPEEAEFLLAASEIWQQQAPMSAAEAAAAMLEGVREGRWRILVGDDAKKLDNTVRDDPDRAYEKPLFQLLG